MSLAARSRSCPRTSLPHPFVILEASGGLGNEKALGHSRGGLSPACAPSSNRRYDDGAVSDVKLNLVDDPSLFNERLRYANPTRVAHADQARLHGRYVGSIQRSHQERSTEPSPHLGARSPPLLGATLSGPMVYSRPQCRWPRAEFDFPRRDSDVTAWSCASPPRLLR
jgi:hypothetical protein